MAGFFIGGKKGKQMSQNYFQIGNQLVLTGWDKNTSSAFVTLGYLNEERDDWIEPLLMEIDFPFDRINGMHYVDEIIVAIKSKLSYFGVRMPESVYRSITAEIQGDVGNQIKVHSISGEIEICSTVDPVGDGWFNPR